MNEKDLIKKAIEKNTNVNAPGLTSGEVLTPVSSGAKAGGRGFAGAIAVIAVMALAIGTGFALSHGNIQTAGDSEAKPSATMTVTSRSEAVTQNVTDEKAPVTTTTAATQDTPDTEYRTTTVSAPFTEDIDDFDDNKGLSIALENAGLADEGKKGNVVLNIHGSIGGLSSDCYYKFTYLDKARNEINIYNYAVDRQTYAITNKSRSTVKLKGDNSDRWYLCYLLKTESTKEDVHRILGTPDEVKEYDATHEYFYIDDTHMLDVSYFGGVITVWNTDTENKTSTPVVPMSVHSAMPDMTVQEGSEQEFLQYNSDKMIVTFINDSIDQELAFAYQSYVVSDDIDSAKRLVSHYNQYKEGITSAEINVSIDNIPDKTGGITMLVWFMNDNGETVIFKAQDMGQSDTFAELTDGVSDCVTGRIFYFDKNSDIYKDMKDIWNVYYEVYGATD